MSDISEDMAPPWAQAPAHCIGWVPNADGHLSFSLIGLGTRPSCRRYTARFLGDSASNAKERRKVACFQERSTPDIPWLVRRFQSDAYHHWLMTGETRAARYCNGNDNGSHDIHDDQGMLLGEITILLHQDSSDAQKLKNSIVKNIRNILRANRVGDSDDVFTELENEKTLAKNNNLIMMCVNFALFRTGEAHFWLDQENIDKLSLPETPSIENHSEVTASAGISELTASQSVLRQAFYFLKDISHCHVHHDGDADQIVPTVFKRADEVEEEGAPSPIELRWQRETLWALSRAIDEFIRTNGRESLRNALGIICFAESFQSMIAGRVRITGNLNSFADTEKNLHHYDFKSLRESVKVSLERNTWKLAGLIAMVGSSIAIALSSIATVNSIWNTKPETESTLTISTKIIQISTKFHNANQLWPDEFINFIFDNPFLIPILSVISLFLGYLLIYSESNNLKSIFAFENLFGKFAYSHSRYFMNRYKYRKRRTIVVVLISFIFILMISILLYTMRIIYQFMATLS